MAVFSGTNIVNDGLVFHFDLQNSVKSWKGKPTSNLIEGGVGLGGMGLSLTYQGLDDGWRKYSISGTWTNGTYPYSMNITRVSFTGGVTYSSQCKFKTNVREKYVYFCTNGINYVNQPKNKNGTGFATTYEENGETIYFVKREGFEYTNTTAQLGYIFSRPLDNATFNPSTDFVWAKEGQVEVGEFSTRPVEGIRLDTATIVDVSPNKNSIKAQNLTYRQDDTPTFDGTDDFFEITTTVNAKSVIAWIKLAVADGSEGIIYGPTANGHDNWFAIASNQVKIFATQTADVNNTNTFGGTELSANVWYQVGMTIDGDTVRAYLNGNLDGTSVKAFTVGEWNSVASIGRRGNIAQRYFNGEIDQVKVYDRVLTDAEIKQNFEATRSRYGV